MHTEPTQEHRWLQQLVGEWTFTNECVMGPSGEKAKSQGREVVRKLGDLWIVAEGEGEMPGGGRMQALLTIGYDPAKKRFVGTWVGSPMANLFVYEGRLDATGKVLTLETQGPSFTDPTKLATYQDIIDVRGPNERRFYSQAQLPDGSWNRFMDGVFLRKR